MNHVAFPLQGGINSTYATGCRVYVPGLKTLNGHYSGILVENGRFDAEASVHVFWDTLKKAGELPPEIPKFTDIAGHWGSPYIKFAMENGLFVGTSETIFSPDAGEIQPWAAGDVRRVARAGCLMGDETGAFRPGANATRAEAATVLTRLFRAYPDL